MNQLFIAQNIKMSQTKLFSPFIGLKDILVAWQLEGNATKILLFPNYRERRCSVVEVVPENVRLFLLTEVSVRMKVCVIFFLSVTDPKDQRP